MGPSTILDPAIVVLHCLMADKRKDTGAHLSRATKRFTLEAWHAGLATIPVKRCKDAFNR
jgi:hypothetical protein